MGRGGNQKERKGRDGKGRVGVDKNNRIVRCRDQHDAMLCRCVGIMCRNQHDVMLCRCVGSGAGISMGSGAGISCRDQHDVMMLGSTRCGFEGVPAGRRVCKSGHPGCLLEENKAPSIKSQGASRAVMASMPFYSLLITCISNGETGALMSAMLPPC
eukprot:scaffold162440_cov22-Tisochrysis_lutea.AAC.1